MSELAADVVVVGSGVAGLSAAIRLARGGLDVVVASKGPIDATATSWAQGGVAAVVDEGADSIGLHVADTLAAGAGLCDRRAVEVLVEEGPQRIAELLALGAAFDREADGSLALAREGGHSASRVLHAGGAATGAEVQRALDDGAAAAGVRLASGHQGAELLLGADGIEGIELLGADGLVRARAPHVVLATGGAGQLFSVTTNPPQATGDGIAMALRAGAAVADVEFVQFHPTALHVELSPRPLLSEALRGHGALLRDAKGERFVDELAPRDVVARAIVAAAAQDGSAHVWLDVTGLASFAERFPSLFATLRQAGLDPAVDWLPVSPAAHHLAGGVLSDLQGASSLPGLWAIGETADAGVHGANRLASNSLLEGLVFGGRLAEALLGGQRGPTASGALAPLLDPDDDGIALRLLSRSPEPGEALREDRGMPGQELETLQAAMTAGAGVLRDEAGMARALSIVRGLRPAGPARRPAEAELANLVAVAEAVLLGALARQESRGGHFRTDFPRTEPSFELRLAQGLVA